jgi:TrmH family RNA methyltransferase
MNMEALSKARIQYIQALQHKKYRLKYDKFIVEGLKISIDIIRENSQTIEEIYVSNPDYQPILENSIKPEMLHVISPQHMHQISQMTTPPGVLCVCRIPPAPMFPDQLSGQKIFYLDAIRDPGNLGTILRIADWFGLDFVGLSPDCVDIFNHKVLQASMGSALRVPSCEVMREELLLKENAVLIISDASGKNIYQTPPPDEGVVILGNESLGVSGDFMHRVKEIIAIPSSRSRGAESLNVASAAAVIASWWTQPTYLS